VTLLFTEGVVVGSETSTMIRMGMDVMGINPTSEKGSYFRRNVWGWHPLWTLVSDLHPDLAAKVEYGYSNDGDGLEEEDSKLLSSRLRDDLASARVTAYIDQREALLAALPDDPCPWCDATGVRRDEVGVAKGMPERGWCNGCDGKGHTPPWAASYRLEYKDVVEFAAFLADCGGFAIY
jgi:hypothetical protein